MTFCNCWYNQTAKHLDLKASSSLTGRLVYCNKIAKQFICIIWFELVSNATFHAFTALLLSMQCMPWYSQCCASYYLEDSIFILKIQDSILSCILKILFKSIFLEGTFQKYLDKDEDTFHKILLYIVYSTWIISQPLRVCIHYMITWNDNNTRAQFIQ